jgi:hemin uptake protein HemP
MSETHDPKANQSEAPRGDSDEAPKVVSAQELFAGGREICIEHEGERYVLRITRRNKLILQK